MSYNIDTWKTKVLENFRIPMLVLHTDKYTKIILNKNGTLTAHGYSECFEMVGTEDNGDFVVTNITSYGDGSGTFHEDFFKNKWLPQSKGKLEAVLIWEGGDSITRIKSDDGVVEETEIDL